jgi:hypothetical protein
MEKANNLEMLIDIKMRLQDIRREAEAFERGLIMDIWEIGDYIEKELGSIGISEIYDVSKEFKPGNMYKRCKEDIETEIFYTGKYFDKYGKYIEDSVRKLIPIFREQIRKIDEIMDSTGVYQDPFAIERQKQIAKEEEFFAAERERLANEEKENGND